jgi:hypothetical protein
VSPTVRFRGKNRAKIVDNWENFTARGVRWQRIGFFWCWNLLAGRAFRRVGFLDVVPNPRGNGGGAVDELSRGISGKWNSIPKIKFLKISEFYLIFHGYHK